MIGWYVHHHGSGHLQQLRLVSRHLESPVTVLSSLGRPPWWEGEWIVLPSDAGAVARTDVTAGGVLHWAPLQHPGLRRRSAAIAGWIERACPRILVSDVSVEVALLARLLGVPVVVAAMRGCRTDRAHAAAYDLAHTLLAPWPAAFACPDWPRRWHAKTWHVGAFSAFDGLPCERRATPARRVFVMMGKGGSEVTRRTLDDARAATPGWEWEAAGVGSWLSAPVLWRELCRADVVITHAGQNAVAEVAAARQPAIVVAQPRPHGEQVDTARTLDRAGIATGLTHWPDQADLTDLLGDAEARGGSRWRDWSSGDGAVRAGRKLDRLALAVEQGTVCARP